MTFVIVSRTALVTMPIMLAVFGLLHLRWRANLVIFGAVAACSRRSPGSPRRNWSATVKTFSRDYQLYKQGVPTSIGERLEYWRNSLQIFRRRAGDRPRHRIDQGAFRTGRDRTRLACGSAGCFPIRITRP